MSASGGPATGTGFLFGNIDKQGRLEEEYLSDEAKDNLDHIGTKVTEKHHELNEIREAIPGDKHAHSDEEYDDHPSSQPSSQPSAIPPKPAGDDMYEDAVSVGDADDDIQFLDEDDRAALAKRALNNRTNPSTTANEEENYDDDDDDDRPVASFPPTSNSTAQPTTSPILRSAIPASRLSPTAPVKPVSSPQRQSGLPLATRALPVPLPKRASKPAAGSTSDADEHPILFSEIFARPLRRLKFTRRPRCSVGLVVDNPQPPPPCQDDSDLFNRAATPPNLDPVALTLAMDEPHRRLLYPTAPEIRPRHVEVVPSREYKEAAAPLLPPAEGESPTRASQTPQPKSVPPAPFQVFQWENEIIWNDPDEKDDDSTDWYGPSGENCLNGPKPEPSPEDSMDEDDFEEPVLFNHASSAASQIPKKKDKADDSDDDDEMEWEDGHLSDSNDAPDPKKPSGPKSLAARSGPSVPSVPVTVPSSTKGKPSSAFPTREDEPAPTVPIDLTVNNQHESSAEDGFFPPAPDMNEGSEIVKTIIAPNKELADGLWVHNIIWDSQSEHDSDETETEDKSLSASGKHDHPGALILDMNDPNMVFEHLSDDGGDSATKTTVGKSSLSGPLSKGKMQTLLTSSGAQVHQILQADSFNISNDLYYASGTSQHFKLDRGLIMRGLQNAPPANKIQTTPSALSDAELLSFRRPKLSSDKLPKNVTVQAVRRKRVKGGNAQIAGQIPKKKTELRCSEKDAYRISVFEYALERQPCILPIPGMASRICTYARKDSAEEVQRAINAAAGTADADTIFMCPDDLPPLAAGNVEVLDKPLSVVESQIYVAPCAKTESASTDFLLVRHGQGKKSMFVREIDSLISVGITEPKVEVMTPNTERYKKYSRERMVLWVMREFQRMKKEITSNKKKPKDKDDGNDPSEQKPMRVPPYIEKEEIYKEFPRRRTYPETGLLRALKELSRFQNGKYTQEPEQEKKYGSKEQELLRILTATETAAFESMESGWEQILDRGILNFTHPSGQGNILAAAEADRSGLTAGPAVGKYIKSHLLKTPWYRSQNILVAHRLQRKDLLQALSLARIVNDLKEGGDVMEAKLMTLTPADMNNVLGQAYRFNSKKIPLNLEEKRAAIREVCQKKGKGAPSPEVSDYPTIISNVLKKHRDAGLSKGAAIAAMGTSMAGGTFLGIPLPSQRRALENGHVDSLPAEEDDFVPDKETDNILAKYWKESGKKNEGDNDNGVGSKRPSKKGRPLTGSNSQKTGTSGDGTEKSGTHSSKSKDGQAAHGTPAGNPPDGVASNIVEGNDSIGKGSGLGTSKGGASADGEESKKQTRKKVTRLKVTKNVTAEDGTQKAVVSYVTDPKEIARLLDKKNAGKDGGASKKKSADEPSASGGLKIAIDLKRLQGGKAGLKKKKTVGPEKSKKSKVSSKSNNDGNGKAVVTATGAEKKGQQIGKIKINRKHLQERAALKRKRSQYSDEIDGRVKKVQKTSRKKRNGTVELNGILERVETIVRKTEGYVIPESAGGILKIARLKDGESPPPGVEAKNLANPQGTGLDFTAPVDMKTVSSYRQIVKKPMYLNLIRLNCKQMKYERASEFLDDMKLMMNNAKAFNRRPEVQWVVQHAELLHEVSIEQVSRRADDIRMAEDMVKMEKADAKASGGGAANSKRKNKAKGGQNDKKGSDKKKKLIKDKITIPDDDNEKAVNTTNVVDLSGPDGREVEEIPSDGMDGVTPVASSSLPQPMLGAGMTDDIFAIDDSNDGRGDGQGAENLVLHLDDVGIDGL